MKWLTTRLRTEHVLSSAAKEATKPAEITLQPPPIEPEDKTSKEPSEKAAKEVPPGDKGNLSREEESKKTASHDQKGAA